MALFGSATPVSKLVGETFPAMLASGIRMLAAVAVLLPAFVIRRAAAERRAPRPGWRDLLPLAGIAVVGTFGFTLFYGMRVAPSAVGAVVMATTPAVTAAGAVVFLSASLTRWKVLGLALVVSGVVTVNLGGPPGGSAPIRG